VRAALARGDEVHALARDPEPVRALGLAEAAIHCCDLNQPTGLDDAMAGIEGVIHCAAVTSTGRTDRALSRKVNVEGTGALLAAAHRNGVRRWVQISSMTAHPASTSAYGTSKREADDLLRAAAPPPAWTILRPSLIYGPGTLGLVAKTVALARKLPVLPVLGSGRGTMKPVHVDDLAAGALAVLTLPATEGKSYMLGGKDEITVDGFMRRLLEAEGLRRPVVHLPLPMCMMLARSFAFLVKKPPITVDNVLGVKETPPVDDASARREWNWAPRGLDEGLADTFATRSSTTHHK
jgi:NADH dehydrogenase